ncbi:MAG: hypothetical protein HY514_00670 [Candidatus Aenigmarchaeota archaeon]|nr:hypothetical protein [Candidatus Aenigmarchaeota archaeon]
MVRTVTVTGKIISGPLRGKPLVDLFFYQLTHVLGFEPFKGTLDMKISRPIDIQAFATKTVDRVLFDGSRHIDLFIAPVTIAVWKKDEYVELAEQPDFRKKDLRERIEDLKKQQEQIIQREKHLEELFNESVERHDCFAIQEKNPINRTVIELVDKIQIKEKFGLKDGDIIDIIFYEKERKEKPRRLKFLKWKK